MVMSRKTFLMLFFCGALLSVNLYAGNWLNDVTNTVNTVNSVVNANKLVKIDIDDLADSGKQYINKQVQVSGMVAALAVDDDNNYFVFLQKSGATVKCQIKANPNCKLKDHITVTGKWNGKEIIDSQIKSNALF